MSESRKIFGTNVKIARLSLNLSQKKFSQVLNLSKTTINNIEIGKESVDESILFNVSKFLGFSKKSLEKPDFKIDVNYRDRLAKKYKNKSQYEVLQDKPELKFAILNYLLKSNLLDQPIERKEIVNFFKTMGWTYHGGSISNALMEMRALIKIEWSDKKDNTRLYSKLSDFNNM